MREGADDAVPLAEEADELALAERERRQQQPGRGARADVAVASACAGRRESWTLTQGRARWSNARSYGRVARRGLATDAPRAASAAVSAFRRLVAADLHDHRVMVARRRRERALEHLDVLDLVLHRPASRRRGR